MPDRKTSGKTLGPTDDIPWEYLEAFREDYELLDELQTRYTNQYFVSDEKYDEEMRLFRVDRIGRYRELRSSVARKPRPLFSKDEAKAFMAKHIDEHLLRSYVGEEPTLASKSQVEKKYAQLLAQLTPSNNDFIGWLHRQPQFVEALRRFDSKAIATTKMMYWSREYRAEEPNTNPELPPRFHLPLISVQTVLAGIVANAFHTYREASVNGAGGYASPSAPSLRKLGEAANRLDEIIESDATLRRHLSGVRVSKEIDKYIDSKVWEFDLVSVMTNHAKAPRELLIFEYAWEYSSRFFYGRDRKGDATRGPLVLEYKRPHADVLVSIASLVDMEITERKVHEILSRFENKLVSMPPLTPEIHEVIDRWDVNADIDYLSLFGDD